MRPIRRRVAAYWLLTFAIVGPLTLSACGNEDDAQDAVQAVDPAGDVPVPPAAEPVLDPELAGDDAAEESGDIAAAAPEADAAPPPAEIGEEAVSAAPVSAALAEASDPVEGEPAEGNAIEGGASAEGGRPDEIIEAAPIEPTTEDDAAPPEPEVELPEEGAGPALPAVVEPPQAAAAAADPPSADNTAVETAAVHISDLIEPNADFLALVEAGDLDLGRRQLLRCGRCHSIREEDFEAERLGPPLYDIIGARIGRAEFYEYSDALLALDDDLEWTVGRLDAFITDPTGTLPGTTMQTSGVEDERERADLIAFLLTLAPEPEPEAGDPEVVEALLTRIADADIVEGAALTDALCARCHSFDVGGETIVGPNLHDVVGQLVGAAEDFTYSASMRALNEEGAAWSFVRLDTFLEIPVLAVPGTRMGFSGVPDPEDRAAIIAYLRTLADAPVPLDNDIAIAAEANDNNLLPLVFTQEQVDAGREAYGREECLACHGRSLTGVVDVREGGVGMGTALVGVNFQNRWFNGPVLDLFRYTQRAMPIGEAGTLSDETYIRILAYILSENGFAWGDEPLPTDPEALRQMGFHQLP